MQYTIIFTANRVIRRMTSDDPPQVLSDETAIDTTTANLDLKNGPWKLDADDKTLVTPTQAEIDTANPIKVRQDKIDDVIVKMDDIINNITKDNVVDKLKAFIQSYKDANVIK